jgi:hypothetical protein
MPQSTNINTTIDTKTTINVWEVSTLVGHTTFLISVLDSRINLIAFEPKLVKARATKPKINKNTTPSTL